MLHMVKHTLLKLKLLGDPSSGSEIRSFAHLLGKAIGQFFSIVGVKEPDILSEDGFES